MKQDTTIGNLFALITIIVWGSTFISSKLLLETFTPLQVMFMRFIIAYVVLWLIRPRCTKPSLKGELACFAMGIMGCTVYFLMENTALTYTLASNVSIIVTCSPILTALLAHFFTKDEKLNKNVWLGFVIAFLGVALVVFNGTVILKLNPFGDLLSFGAACSWAVYSVILKRFAGRIDGITLTRKTMFYGAVTSAPLFLIDHTPFPIAQLAQPALLLNVLFLGVIGSGVCYVLWNRAACKLGIVRTNNYIYVIPFVTMIAAAVFLNETITVMGILGAVLIILGIVISDRKKPAHQKRSEIKTNV